MVHQKDSKGYTIYHSDGSTKEVSSEHTPIIDKLAADDSDESINNFYDTKHIPSNTVKVEKDGTVQDYDVRSKEYKDLYNSGNLTSYNDKTNTYIATPMKPFEVSAKKQYDYEGCVAGLCNSLAEKYDQPVEEFRKLSNLYGDAWVFNKTNFGTDVDISKGYSNLKEGDVINLSRGAFSSDTKKGIPSKNQHVGYVSKIENGVPYVKHYITGVGVKSDGTSYGEYFEEPINNIKEKYAYTPSGARRIDYNKDIEYKDSNFKFDDNYTPNTIEEGIAKAHSQKKELQNVLKLNSDEYDELAKVAYGIMGNESSYGRSTKTLYRMAVPDFIQKGVKVAHDFFRDKDVYDDNINNLSQGYSSTKESSLHGVSSSLDKNRAEVNKQIKSGDYTNLTRDNNYLYTAMNKLGINPDNLEDGENATKAIMTTLSWYKKRNPNATTEDLLKMYTGKKDITAYKASFDSYLKNINTNAADNKEYSWFDDLLGKASALSNKTVNNSKQINSSMISYIRDKSPLPENVNALFSDLMGGKKDITEKSLSSSTIKELSKIIKKNVSEGKTTISYDDYGTSEDKNSDVGKGNVSNDKKRIEKDDNLLAKAAKKAYNTSTDVIKMTTDEKYILKTLLGQASIKKINGNTYEIQDTYDFNDKGSSFGLIDDLKKRGYSPYAIVRALGRNYGSQSGQGSKVKIRIKID